MLKLTKTGIGLLTKQYRSVLKKCLLLNLGVLAGVIFSNSVSASVIAGGVNMTVEELAYMTLVGSKNLKMYTSGDGYGLIYDTSGNSLSSLAMEGTLTNYIQSLVTQQGILAGIGNYSISDNVYLLDRAIGKVNAGNYVKAYSASFSYNSRSFSNSNTISDNINALDTAIGAKIASDGHYIKKSDTNSITANLSALDYALYNYYYTFWVDESEEVTDSASFFQKDFSTLQEVDLQSKNPTQLGAFAKCDEVCPRPSERFSLLLSQEQMLKNDASVDAGTSRHCLRQFGDVVADLLKNTAAKGLRIYEFMNEEVCHA